MTTTNEFDSVDNTSVDTIRSWLRQGRTMGATHVIVIYHSLDWRDTPRFVMPHESVRTVHAEENGRPNQSVMEVYNLRRHLEAQLREDRAIHFD